VNAFARRLALWRLLESSPEPLGLKALADRFEVSKHTIQRDLDALSKAGVPVTEERRGQAVFFSIRTPPGRFPQR
jgi:predicted DNA-binding transcriptional regulator YafY